MSIVTPPVSNVAPGGGEGFSLGIEGNCSDDPLSASVDKLQKLLEIKTDPQSTGSTASVDNEASDHELMEIDSQEEVSPVLMLILVYLLCLPLALLHLSCPMP